MTCVLKKKFNSIFIRNKHDIKICKKCEHFIKFLLRGIIDYGLDRVFDIKVSSDGDWAPIMVQFDHCTERIHFCWFKLNALLWREIEYSCFDIRRDIV